MRYVWRAFLYHWNLLFVGGGVALGLISGLADVLLPLLAAGEILYISVLSTNSRFQRAVDAAAAPSGEALPAGQSDRLLAALRPGDRKRFQQLKRMGLRLSRLSTGGEAEEPGTQGLAGIRTEGINRLLWVYLKLLYSRGTLDAYFQTVNREDIVTRIRNARRRLEALGTAEDDVADAAKKRESLEDTLATCRKRLSTYEQSRKNYDFLTMELDRLHAKVASLAEMGINRQDPRLIMNEIDLASTSIEQTESAIRDLDFLAEIGVRDGPVPDLLESG
jgi:hypothetical protein